MKKAGRRRVELPTSVVILFFLALLAKGLLLYAITASPETSRLSSNWGWLITATL